MRTLHLIGDDDMYINLAFLLSEQCTHMIKLAVFEGSKNCIQGLPETVRFSFGAVGASFRLY